MDSTNTCLTAVSLTSIQCIRVVLQLKKAAVFSQAPLPPSFFEKKNHGINILYAHFLDPVFKSIYITWSTPDLLPSEDGKSDF